MLIDLTFRNLTQSQALALLAAAPTASAAGAMEEPARARTEASAGSGSEGAHVMPAAKPVPLGSGLGHTGLPIPPTKPTERVPGEDDGPPLSEADAAFFRAPTVKAVVKMLVGDQAAPDEAAVLARVRDLRLAGVAALEAVPEEQLADRVASSLAALGF